MSEVYYVEGPKLTPRYTYVGEKEDGIRVFKQENSDKVVVDYSESFVVLTSRKLANVITVQYRGQGQKYTYRVPTSVFENIALGDWIEFLCREKPFCRVVAKAKVHDTWSPIRLNIRKIVTEIL